MWGMILSAKNIINAPNDIPKIAIPVEEKLMLSGINSKKDIASITPPAKASILNMNFFEGSFIIPTREPMTGPKTEIAKIVNKVFILPLFMYIL